jgi:hypothetical protein
MKVIVFYENGILFNPDCIYSDKDKGRIVAKKGLDYYAILKDLNEKILHETLEDVKEVVSESINNENIILNFRKCVE